MPEPVTESLVVHWRPTVQYHLHRIRLLEVLQSEGVLDEWRVDGDEVGARTESVQLTMAEGRVLVHPRGPIADEALDLLRRALQLISPPRYHFHVLYQFLLPIPGRTYDEARQVALRRLPGSPFGTNDFALILDGETPAGQWHGEFGIVSEDEVEPRLRRWISQIPELGSIPLFVDVPTDLSPASFYASVMWATRGVDSPDPVEDAVDGISAQLGHLKDEATRLVSQTYADFCEGSLQSVAGGS